MKLLEPGTRITALQDAVVLLRVDVERLLVDRLVAVVLGIALLRAAAIFKLGAGEEILVVRVGLRGAIGDGRTGGCTGRGVGGSAVSGIGVVEVVLLRVHMEVYGVVVWRGRGWTTWRGIEMGMLVLVLVLLLVGGLVGMVLRL